MSPIPGQIKAALSTRARVIFTLRQHTRRAGEIAVALEVAGMPMRSSAVCVELDKLEEEKLAWAPPGKSKRPWSLTEAGRRHADELEESILNLIVRGREP